MPRLDKKFSPKTKEKFNKLIMNQDEEYFTVDLYAFKPLLGSTGNIEGEGIKVTELQNTLNTTIKDNTSTQFIIPIVVNDRLSTSNGLLKCKLLGAGQKPLESQIKGNNTIS
ncbi:hypothetical protein [Mycobacterium sp.]|uniref:hypothetical protein n=1 Tax=Mycobacterium sp. TaxID=1785 RepID=UPI003A8AA5D7